MKTTQHTQDSAPVELALTNDKTGLASLLEGTTPGPWFKQGSYISKTPTGRRFLIAEVYRDGTVQMTEANARLIAAAPALLAEVAYLRKQRDALAASPAQLVEALSMFEQGPPDGDDPADWFAQYAVNLSFARAALANARNMTKGGGR